MKTKILLGSFLLFGLFACEKNGDEVTEPIEKTPDYFPKTTGSYWVYNTYEIDSLGNEELINENDTIIVTGDTTINGNSFKVFFGKRLGIGYRKVEMFYRDSAEFIVDSEGKKVFSQTNFTDTLYLEALHNAEDTSIYWFSKMTNLENEVQLPANTFDSLLNAQITLVYCNDSIYFSANFHNLYAPNVGKIIKQYAWVGGYERVNIYYEERLVSYSIETE